MAGIFRKIWRDIKKGAVILLLISLAGSVIYTISKYGTRKSRIKFYAIVDSDSGNGVDDIMAISRALSDPGFSMIGLTASQWNNNSFGYQRSEITSHEQNEILLKLFGHTEIPNYRGGEPFNARSPLLHSENDAARFIVSKAHETARKKKLNIVTLGAMTNVASAILLDSTIIPKLRIYAMAMQYIPKTKIWNKNESNARSDLDALDYLLDLDELEMHIMPLSVALNFRLDSTSIYKVMRKGGLSGNYLMDQWSTKFPNSKELPLPSLAFIEAILNPDFAKTEQTMTPPENNRKIIQVYTWINAEFMKIDYEGTIQKISKEASRQKY